MPKRDRPTTTAGLSIRDAVMAQQSPRTSCRVCFFLRRQTEADNVEWLELLAEDADVVNHKSISVVMTERGMTAKPKLPPISSDQVSRHRRENHDTLEA